MWRLRRQDKTSETGTTTLAERPGDGFAGSDEELAAEIDALTTANRSSPSSGTERRLLHLRNIAGIRRMERADDGPSHPEPDFSSLPEADTLPVIESSQLTPELIRAGILRNGCLLVRGLVPMAEAVRFAEQIDRSFAERELHDRSESYVDRYYSEFNPDPRFGAQLARPWIKEGGGVLAVDSPMLSFEMFEMLERARLPEVVKRYLGEAALITAQKTTLRKADPSVPGAWHQDGKFMGRVRALNLWLSLSRCGDEAPGLDIVPRRLDDHVTTQTDEAILDYSVSQRIAEEVAGEESILRPIFEPGDALFFDELFLHKTGSDPAMPNPRFAIESWFFGGSAFPVEYAPLAV